MGSIKPNDLNELKKLGKPSDIIKLIFDCVSLLKMAPLVKTETAEVEPKYIILHYGCSFLSQDAKMIVFR